ncbi:MAG: ligase-associated DNA damage response DEXH box helicase [Proteobacteria bacterium]|nr:ligase-associated DNA damage response DEXH box helicase [Pseudomonadota bacterium]
MGLPDLFSRWFENRGWAPRRHQLDLIDLARQGRSALLIAPTGGGKTLAGFLPSLIELTERRQAGRDLAHAKGKGELHTLYISPLKALATDIRRNLEVPIAEMQLPVRAESRTGDTPQSRRIRQRERPPDFLLTTPESLALLLSYPDTAKFFASLRCVIVDELHTFATSKRGHHLALCLARLAALAPQTRFVGLSATVADPPVLADYLRLRDGETVEIVQGEPGAAPKVSIIDAQDRLPWGGHMGQHAVPEVFNIVRQHKTSIVFVNTRAQAELIFDELWRINEENLAIGLHHGSLAIEQRRKVEAAMAAGRLRAVVATSSLDLGIDWGNVDLVIQMGAPKGVSRLMQRIGRANHRLDEPSRAMIAPANRFEVLESLAALEAIEARELDGDPPRPACLDVLAQHIVGSACAQPIDREAFFHEVRRAQPYRDLPRKDFDDTFDFVATGGYALAAYDKWHRLKQLPDGRWMLASPLVARQFRMNVGTIVELPLIKVRLRRGPMLGEVEESFVQGLVQGDTFVFAGRMLRFEGVKELVAICSPATTGDPKVPAYGGGRLPLSTFLAERVRGILQDPTKHPKLPAEVRTWLDIQKWRSGLPQKNTLLVEGFPRGSRQFIVAYCFEGRNAHQTLGMLLTRRMERMGLKPLGFVATDYVLGIWGLRSPTPQQLNELFDEDMLGDDLESWMDESTMLRRSFRNVAVIAGLIERRFPGEEKSRRQVTFSSDLIYDALRKHEPDHILLRATRQDAAHQLADLKRLGDLLRRAKGRIEYRRLDRISPLAVPVLLEIGKERVLDGTAEDELLDIAAQELIDEATRLA